MKIKLTLFALILFTVIHAQGPWVWASSAGGGTGQESSNSIKTIVNGISYVTGSFQAPDIGFGNVVLTHAGTFQDNLFVVKYDNTGNVIWARSPGGNNNSVGKGVSVDGSGNIYVTGTYRGTMILGSSTFSNGGLHDDMFLVKYDVSGNVVWAKTAGGTSSNTSGKSISTDANGNSYVTGILDGDSIDNVMFNTTVITGGLDIDFFVAKYDNSGNLVWVKSEGDSLNDYGTGISIDGSGNSYVSGYFESHTITFGSTTLASNGMINSFVVKFDPSGNIVWAISPTGTSNVHATAISTDNTGNSSITGYFDSPTLTFGSTVLSNNSTGEDIFIAEFDNSGNLIWAQRAGGSADDEGLGIVKAWGNTYVTGSFRGTVTFGTTNLITFTAAGGSDPFVLNYDNTGNMVWAKRTTNGTGMDVGNAISMDNSQCYVTGNFTSLFLTFGTTTLTNVDNSNPSNVFVASVDSGAFVSGVAETTISEDQFSIFPIPSNGIFTVKGKQQFLGELEICNALGEQIYSTAFNGESLSIDISAKPAGVYFLEIKSDKGIFAAKVLVMK